MEGEYWLSLTEWSGLEVGDVACVLGTVDENLNGSATIEFFLVFGPLVTCCWEPIFIDARDDTPPDPPTGSEAPDLRLRFVITSVFTGNGRTTPWSFRKSPHVTERLPIGILSP